MITETLTNWAGNHAYAAQRIHRPDTIEAVREIVSGAHKVKALGTRHAFNSIADSDGDLVWLDRLNRVVSIDRERMTVTVEAGATYGHLCATLRHEGFAVHNLASLPHISVAGACATATHGSGDRNGNLSTAVAAIELIRADGQVVTLVRGRDEEFEGAVVGLGALGIVTRLTLDVVPTFQVRQRVYERLPLAGLEANFDAVTSLAYSVSLFTHWAEDVIDQVWVKSLASDADLPPTLFGATAAPDHRHPIAHMSPVNCTAQMDEAGAWDERLPHFRMEFTPSSGDELQSEFFVPREHAVAALRTVRSMRDQISPLLHISEIRTIAADNLWLSPSYQRDAVGIHFTWKAMGPEVRALLPEIEAALAPYQARPHWAKLFTMSGERLQSLYPRMPDFQRLRAEYDPEGKFDNAYLSALRARGNG